MRIAKSFELSIGHRLSDYSGKCRHLHGHNYVGEVIIEGSVDDLDHHGMLMDFGDLKKLIQDTLYFRFDHKMLLKEGDPFNIDLAKVCKLWGDDSIVWVPYNPTVENIVEDMRQTLQAGFIGTQEDLVVYIKMYETSTSYAEV
jgi:6-pyruvoyltetrahydropterin/6-carboxytetrahydropterin synthase